MCVVWGLLKSGDVRFAEVFFYAEMEALLGLNGAGGIGGGCGGCCCQCEHCRCRQAGATPCPSCRPAGPSTSTSDGAKTSSTPVARPTDVAAAVELLNATLKGLRRRGSLGGANDNYFHAGEVLWGTPGGSSVPVGGPMVMGPMPSGGPSMGRGGPSGNHGNPLF